MCDFRAARKSLCNVTNCNSVRFVRGHHSKSHAKGRFLGLLAGFVSTPAAQKSSSKVYDVPRSCESIFYFTHGNAPEAARRRLRRFQTEKCGKDTELQRPQHPNCAIIIIHSQLVAESWRCVIPAAVVGENPLADPGSPVWHVRCDSGQ